MPYALGGVSMNELLRVKNLKKYFSTPAGMLHAVDDISFTIDAGETLGVVGESGCGKSTAGRSILRMVEPTSGEIIFNGEDIMGKSKAEMKKIRQNMQMIFQDPYESLDPRFNSTQLIEEPLKLNHIFNTAEERRERVKELMETVGISERLATSYPHELDGGRRQRVGIARAMAMEPKLIVGDEPVSALDVSIQSQILNMMQDLQEQKGLAYMFITHDLSVVRHISNKICIMYLGQIVEMSETEELFTNTLHPYTQALLSAIPVPSRKKRRERIILQGEITSPINPPEGCRFAKRCIYAKPECFEKNPVLCDVGNGHLCACHKVANGTAQ